MLKEGSLRFSDDDGNDRLDAYEKANISFIIQNLGKGPAIGIKAITEVDGGISGLDIEYNTALNTIEPGKDQYISIPVYGRKNLTSGDANLTITIKEPNGLDCDPILVHFNTLKFQEPKIEIVDGVFSSDAPGNVFKKKIPAKLEFIVQNTGQSKTDKVTVSINAPTNILSLDGNLFNVGTLQPNESKALSFGFIATNNYNLNDVTINLTTQEGFGMYGSNKSFSVKLDQKLSSSKLVVQGEAFKEKDISKNYLTSDVDRDIPVNYASYPNRYALVIGNEDYSSKQTSLSTEVDVAFAKNDANSFKEYLINTLGFKDKHVTVLLDATSGEISREIEKLVALGKLDESAEIVFYYAGHGLPDENKHPYLIPVDVSAINMKQNGIALKSLYTSLSSSKAKKITVFLDACFSGGGRDQGLLAARTVKIRPKEESFLGNMVVFASSSGEEKSLPYDEKQHGLFTYFLLKKLKETKGSASYGELSEYIKSEVTKTSLIENNLKQTPHTNISTAIVAEWKNWSLK